MRFAFPPYASGGGELREISDVPSKFPSTIPSIRTNGNLDWGVSARYRHARTRFVQQVAISNCSVAASDSSPFKGEAGRGMGLNRCYGDPSPPLPSP